MYIFVLPSEKQDRTGRELRSQYQKSAYIFEVTKEEKNET